MKSDAGKDAFDAGKDAFDARITIADRKVVCIRLLLPSTLF